MSANAAVQEAKPIAITAQDAANAFASLVSNGMPSFFKLRARLPSQGRTDTPIAATEDMTIVLKTYAADGENELHAHTNEDHVFVVLKGRANFYGPKDEKKSIGVHEGVLLPRGSFYWFKADGDEPLVMIRISSTRFDPADPMARFARINAKGEPMAGDSKENKQVELIYSDEWFGRD